VRAFKDQRTYEPVDTRPGDQGRLDAVRSWLANGHHIFGIDPRRRLGRHPHARQLLADDLRAGQAPAGEWQALASALDRHTIRGGMAELSPEEGRVITLAYLEGRTNREIAALLGVSVSTVRRRLWAALERLDAYVSHTKTWLSAIILVGAGYLGTRAHRLERMVSADWTQRAVSAVAVSAVAAVAIGLTAVAPDSTGTAKSSTPRQAPMVAAAPGLGLPSGASGLSSLGAAHPSSLQTASSSTGAGRNVKVVPPAPAAQAPPPTGAPHPNHGCGGNPTSAAPPVPVGRHSYGSPVTHPSAGGCRP
jgi:DNA-directed RNA polymerase specialized sigma24 family protein